MDSCFLLDSKGFDANPPESIQPTTRWGADPLRMKVGPITRAQAKKFKDNIAAFIQEIINQEGCLDPKSQGLFYTYKLKKPKRARVTVLVRIWTSG